MKGLDAKKSVKKKPAKTAKEKRSAKRSKGVTAGFLPQ